jgi:hypothetical protein
MRLYDELSLPRDFKGMMLPENMTYFAIVRSGNLGALGLWLSKSPFNPWAHLHVCTVLVHHVWVTTERNGAIAKSYSSVCDSSWPKLAETKNLFVI